MSRFVATVALLAALAACSGGAGPRSEVEPTGPAFLQIDVIRRHAAEFATDLSDRIAGSDGEQAASVYILGHLQQAGYVVLLDSVPLADLVRSTNVVAQPPSGESPEVVVTVPYDEPPTQDAARQQGEAVGVMIELARALRVAEPEHRVEFVALGAEHAAESGGRLGSRRLAQTLLDAEARPLVVIVRVDVGARNLQLLGDVAQDLEDAAAAGGFDHPAGGGSTGMDNTEVADDVFKRAGFDLVVITGPPQDVGDVLLEFLVIVESG